VGSKGRQLEGGEAERGAAVQVGVREEVENLVGAAGDEVEPLEGERGSGAVAEEALEAGPVGGLDADAGIEAERRRPGGIEGPRGVRRAREPQASHPPP
jgi:hypothetical protein